MTPAAAGAGMADPAPSPAPAPGTGRRRATWEVVRTDEFTRWANTLHPDRREQVEAAIRRVERTGPTLGRPRVDTVKHSRVHNLKELRINDGVRILFAFDPNRTAVMLVGGDKTGRWRSWYREHVPAAERLYANHLRHIGKEVQWLTRSRGNGGMSR
jgi:hypothetical protein